MHIYSLRPNVDQMSDPRWSGSSHRESCIVHALSSDQARNYVAEHFTPKASADSPWRDFALVDCEPISGNMRYAEGMILLDA